MSERPTPPREAALIATALKRSNLSARAAAQRAGISDARWRQITSGYQTVSGTQVPVRAPADTLARMARTVGATPEQLEEAGRADAAEELRDLAQRDAPPSEEREDSGVRALTAVWETLGPEERKRAMRRLQATEQQEPADKERPPYPDMTKQEWVIWEWRELSKEDRLTMIDLIRQGREHRKHA